MAVYTTFTTARTTTPDLPSLIRLLRAQVDPVAGPIDDGAGKWRIKTAAELTAAQVSAAQAVLDTAPASTPELTAQSVIDSLPIVEKAILLTILDELNLLREWDMSFKAAVAAATSLADLKARVAALPDMPDRTVQQAIAAIRNKAGNL